MAAVSVPGDSSLLVKLIVAIAADVLPALEHEHSRPIPSCVLSHCEPEEAGAHDEEVWLGCGHQSVCSLSEDL